MISSIVYRFRHGAYLDIARGFRLIRLARAIALSELNQQYSRTSIGKYWIALTFSIFVSVKIAIFSSLSDEPFGFFASYLAIGFMLFRFISNAVTSGARVFISAQTWIKTEPLPLTLYLLALLIKNSIMMAYMSLTTVLICFLTGYFSLTAILCIPFFLLIFSLNHFWVSCVLGILAARYRDVLHLVNTIMQIMLFITPILWVAPQSGIRAWIATLNPLTHYLAIIRDPFIANTIPWTSWTIVSFITLSGCLVAIYNLQKYRRNIVYWI